MAIELWIINILKVIFIIIGGHIAITKVVPLLSDFLQSFIRDNKAVDAFTSLIDIFILVTVGLISIESLLAVENNILNYIEVLQPGFTVLSTLFTYIQWILLGLMLVVAFKNFKT